MQYQTYAQYGFGTNTPSKASVVDVQSGTKGMLVPRVALSSTDSFSPITGINSSNQHTVNSLIVYNSATSGTGATAVKPGYYYWFKPNASIAGKWIRSTTNADVEDINLLGDVTGALANNKVEKIQNVSVVNTLPTNGQFLRFNGTAWTPTTTSNVIGNQNNSLTSTVNGISSSTNIVTSNSLTATNGNMVSTVNGVASSTAVQVLTTASNGLNAVNGNVRLGGSLAVPTTIAAGTTNTLAVTGLQTGATTDYILVSDPATGVLKQVKATMPKFFYMPSVVFDISVVGTFTRNLYNEYLNQFGSPIVSSSGATEGIPTLLASQLEYHITYYDANVFENLVIDQNGSLTYRVKNSSASEKTFMNIVFMVKK